MTGTTSAHPDESGVSCALPKKDPTQEEREAQLRAFQDAARELECDDDAERFDERVKRLAQKRAPQPEKPPLK